MTNRFDDLARIWASPMSRRRALRLTLGTLVGAAVVGTDLSSSQQAFSPIISVVTPCTTNNNCVALAGVCCIADANPTGVCCTLGQTCCGGTCVTLTGTQTCCGGTTVCDPGALDFCCGTQCCIAGQTCCGGTICCNSGLNCCTYPPPTTCSATPCATLSDVAKKTDILPITWD